MGGSSRKWEKGPVIVMVVKEPQVIVVSPKRNSNQSRKKGILRRLFIFKFFGGFVFNGALFTSGTLARAEGFDEGCEFGLVHLADVFVIELMERNILE